MSAKVTTPTIPPALAQIAAGRDHIVTSEFGHAVGRADQTIRKSHCYTGHAFGIRPIKFGNRLLWPVADIAALLTGSAVAQTIHPDLFTVKHTAQDRRAISPSCESYEQCKWQWKSQHPEATPAEYDAAMIRIARECGV